MAYNINKNIQNNIRTYKWKRKKHLQNNNGENYWGNDFVLKAKPNLFTDMNLFIKHMEILVMFSNKSKQRVLDRINNIQIEQMDVDNKQNNSVVKCMYVLYVFIFLFEGIFYDEKCSDK